MPRCFVEVDPVDSFATPQGAGFENSLSRRITVQLFLTGLTR